MNTTLFLTFLTVASGLIGFISYIVFLKKSLLDSLIIVAKNYDYKLEQRHKLKQLTDDYLHSLPTQSHDSLRQLDKILTEIEGAISYSRLAIKSNSISFIKEAKKRIKKYHKVNKKSFIFAKDKNEVINKKLKATWSYKAEELIDLVSESISISSKNHNALSHKIPRRYSRKKSTSLVLNEISMLSIKSIL